MLRQFGDRESTLAGRLTWGLKWGTLYAFLTVVFQLAAYVTVGYRIAPEFITSIGGELILAAGNCLVVGPLIGVLRRYATSAFRAAIVGGIVGTPLSATLSLVMFGWSPLTSDHFLLIGISFFGFALCGALFMASYNVNGEASD